MNLLYPWNFNIKNIQKQFTVLFGQDIALAMSFLHESNYTYYTENNLSIEILYEESLYPLLNNTEFDNNKNNIYSIISYKKLQTLTQYYLNQPFACNLVIYVDKIGSQHNDIDYMKCDPITKSKHKAFLKYYNELLQMNLDLRKDYSWIKNLDDMRFAQILQDLNIDYCDINPKICPTSSFDNVWSQLRKEQYNNDRNLRYIYKHFEIWARDHTPNDSCLHFYLDALQRNLSYNHEYDAKSST